MRNLLPWALILLAALLGYFLFAGGEDEALFEVPEGDPLEATDGPPPDRGVDLRGAEKADIGTRPKRPGKAWQPADPRTLPKGVLIVQPIGPDLKPLVDPRLTVIVTPQGQRVSKLGPPDETTGAFRVERVIAGPVTVTVRGDHVMGAVETAKVFADRETVCEVHLERAGAIRYDVITYAKTRPAQVLLELFDATERPAEAWFQTRSTRSMTQPIRTTARTLGPEGVVFGIRPGRYKLKVTNVETEEWDEADVDVEVGVTKDVTLTVRR